MDRYGDLADDGNFDRCLTSMLAEPGIRRLHPDPARIRADFATGPRTYGALFALFHRHHADAIGKERWGDQLGLAEGHADVMLRTFPAAKMIHMVRDPREALRAGARPGALGWTVGKWITSIHLAERNLRLYPERYLVLRLEDLAGTPERTVNEVCTFLDIEATPAMVEVAASLPHVRTAQTAGRADSRSSSGIRYIESRTAEAMGRYGYLPSEPPPRRTAGYTLVDWPANSIALALWKRWSRRKISNTAEGRA
jgi:hypothetical protein